MNSFYVRSTSLKIIAQIAARIIATSFYCGVLLLVGCSQKSKRVAGNVVPATKAEVVHFCAACHAYPEPETFPVHKWREEVLQGYEFYKTSNRSDLTVPNVEAVIAFYEKQAPTNLKIPLPDGSPTTSPIKFSEETLARVDARVPAISDISVSNAQSSIKNSLVVTDMREGQVSLLTFESGKPAVETIAEIPFPSHIERCDLNSDGAEDWLISDLGSYAPADHNKGQLVWLNFDKRGYLIGQSVLLNETGRIADVRAGDFDQDGDLDLVVAIFGWRKQGKLIWLERTGGDSAELEFEEHLLSDRHGCSHVAVLDLNRDGHLDIVALFSQEFESIEAYFGNGSKRFTNSVLYRANDPSYGSSSIELTDFDADGDVDILYTNGDSLDSHLIKPYHSVQWLEQTGEQEFVHHHVTNLPGAYSARAGDIDGDGDLDLVACSMASNFDYPFYSLIWLERQGKNEFIRHNLETGIHQHACLELGDFDLDNDIDIAVGHYEPRPVRDAPWLSIWWNEGKASLLQSK